MHHRIFGRKLGRTHHQRQALFRQQIFSIFTLGKITTTEAKAKSIQPLVEKISHQLITLPLLDSSRLLATYIQDRRLVKHSLACFQKTFSGQSSNFTKLTRLYHRQGDDALMVSFEFVKPVDFSFPKTEEKKTPAKTSKTAKKTVAKTVKKVKTEKKKS